MRKSMWDNEGVKWWREGSAQSTEAKGRGGGRRRSCDFWSTSVSVKIVVFKTLKTDFLNQLVTTSDDNN